MAPTFSGGKLNLKGSKKAKKKSKKSKHKINPDDVGDGRKDNAISKTKDEESLDKISSSDDEDDDLTAAERMSLKRKKQREREELEKVGSKSHRERVEEFNEKLGKLTEHNDIPRVSSSIIYLIHVVELHWNIIFSCLLLVKPTHMVQTNIILLIVSYFIHTL